MKLGLEIKLSRRNRYENLLLSLVLPSFDKVIFVSSFMNPTGILTRYWSFVYWKDQKKTWGEQE